MSGIFNERTYSNGKYYRIGNLVLASFSRSINVDSAGELALPDLPKTKMQSVCCLRDTMNGKLAQFTLSHDSATDTLLIAAYNAVNYTRGNNYSGMLVYIASE